MWRHHPRTHFIQNLVNEGTIGKVLHIRAALSVSANPGDIRRTGSLGGGAYLDLGCYCISAIRLFGGEPQSVSALSVIDKAEGAEGSDLRTAATMLLEGGRSAQFDVALDFPRRDELEVIGSKGKISIPDPWLCRVGHVDVITDSDTTRLSVSDTHSAASDWDPDNIDAYRIEIERASAEFLGHQATTFGRDDALLQASALEAVHKSAETAVSVTPQVFTPSTKETSYA